jgi:hypothetical protein
MEHAFETMLASFEKRAAHLPSRVRSLLWILSAMPILAEFGEFIADETEIREELAARLPALPAPPAEAARAVEATA